MKRSEIQIGKLYTMKVGRKSITVRVDDIGFNGSFGHTNHRFFVTNLVTGHKEVYHSAENFKAELQGVNADAWEYRIKAIDDGLHYVM